MQSAAFILGLCMTKQFLLVKRRSSYRANTGAGTALNAGIRINFKFTVTL